MAKTNSRRSGQFRSHFEAATAINLAQRKVEFDYEAWEISYTVEKVYTPDFRIGNFFVETKGYFPPEDRAKMIAVKKCNPDADIRLVFMKADSRLSNKSNTTYAQWADKHGFKWSEGVIPDEWLAEARHKTSS